MHVHSRFRRAAAMSTRLRALAAVAGTALLIGCGGSDVDGTRQVPLATVSGPVAAPVQPGDASRNYPYYASNQDLARWGYVEEEFFIEGTANAFNVAGTDTGSVIEGGHAYRTRLLVRRPVEAANFEGTVFVEWSNVTGNNDSDNDFHQVYEHVLRSGYAWVVASVQQVGVHATPNGLKAWSPARYGALDLRAGGAVTNDALKFDVYTQVGKALRARQGVAPLGPLVPQRVIGTGHSQSAVNLISYYNSVLPLRESAFDAFILRGAVNGGALRRDLPQKVFFLLSESDVPLQLPARAPDADNYRLWEVAGTSHGDYQGQALGRGPLALRDNGTRLSAECAIEPQRSRVPFHHVMAAAMTHTVAWVRSGTPPPSGASHRIRLGEGASPAVVRDASGNALGGIRLADMQVPIAQNSGENAGPGLCFIRGRTIPFDAPTLAALYPSQAAYVDAVRRATEQNVANGFILARSAAATVAKAQASYVGLGGACEALCRQAGDLRNRTQSFAVQPDAVAARLLALLDEAAQQLARPGGDRQLAGERVRTYLHDIRELGSTRQLRASIVADLAADAEALIAAIGAGLS